MVTGETTSSSIHGGFPPQIPAPSPTPWFPQSPFTGDRTKSNWIQPVVLLIFPFFILQVPFSVGFPRERRIFPSYTTSHLEPSGHLAGLDVKVGKSVNIPWWEHPPAASAKETLHFHQHLTKHKCNSPPLTFLCMSQTTASFGNPELMCLYSFCICKAVER